MKNLDLANTALTNINNAIENLNKTKLFLDQQVEMIPNFEGQKDELGENVEEFLKEIIKELEDDLINPLNGTMGKANDIKLKAEEIDNQLISQQTVSSNMNSIDKEKSGRLKAGISYGKN